MLLEEGANVNSLDTEQKNGLVYAIERNDLSIIKLLVNNGIEVNNTDLNKEDPLKRAIEHQNLPIIKYLLQHGASTTAERRRGNHLMMMACDLGDSALFDILVERGISMVEKDEKGHNVVIRAYLSNQLNLAKRLLVHYSYRRSINLKNKNGDTLLNLAIKQEDYHFVKFLLEVCPDINFDERNKVGSM